MYKTANFIIKISLLILVLGPVTAQEEPPLEPGLGMTNDRLDELIRRIDENAERNANQWLMSWEEMPILVVTDENADRMRIMTPVADAADLSEEELYRLMQANFESALDARYAIANGRLWSTFIHPLSPLTDEQFFSGVGQTLTLVVTFGGSYSSGVFRFRGGDSPDSEESTPFDDIIRRGQST